MIKPAFFKHRELYDAERASGLPLRIAFAGLWTVADREGRFKWKSDLKPDILPYDDVDMRDVLNALERDGFVVRYVVDGKDYGYIPTFKDHQTFHKTERPSTLPSPSLHQPLTVNPPLSNGEATVPSPADTVTVTVAVTGTVEKQIVDDGRREPVAEPDLPALYLTIWANGAVSEKWGEQPTPYTVNGPTTRAADDLRRTGVEWEVARASIYRQCRESNLERPPRSVAYFRPGIESDWKIEQQRRLQASVNERPPLRALPNGVTPIGDVLAKWVADTEAKEKRNAS